jgi:uncharacterized protein (TIGR00369 family)
VSSDAVSDGARSNSFPFADLVGLQIGDPEDSPSGRDSVVQLEATDDHLNVAGIVHGGVLATMIDTAMGRAVRDVTDEPAATSQLTVTYLDPARQGTLVATARITKRGSTLTLVEAEVEQEGKPVAHALATFALLKS